jgi:Ribonuclease G/E
MVQPSTKVKERFKLEENSETPDLDIYDRYDRQGVRALGKAEAADTFKEILQSHLEDVITRKWKVTTDGIYKGLIKSSDSATHSVLVDIGPATGRIYEEEISDPNAQQIIAQVERRRMGAKESLLTTAIKIPGKYAILILGHQVKVSRKILDWQKRSRLSQLGKQLASPNWGVIWRTAAADQPDDILKNEITSLLKQRELIMKKAEEVEAPAMLWEGRHFMDVEFPALSKGKLNEIRRSVAPTINGHHYYKACGRRISSTLDMAERLLEQGVPAEEAEGLFKQTIEPEHPCVGSVIGMEHVKLDGKVFHLGRALVEDFNHDDYTLCLSLVFEKEGVYDGLKTRKEPGDTAVTEAKVGEWYFKTRYFSKHGKLKGTYINFNTPIELYPYAIRYVDLEVDVCVWPSGKVEKLDEEKLDEALKEGLVTERLVKIIREKTQQIMKSLVSK